MSTTKSSAPSGSTSNILRALIISLTLGLAPFYPEPHILGKVKWVMGGAVGMQPMDWFDFVLHGAPWVILIGVLIWEAKKKFL
jgi:hypothetical protein